MSATPLLADRIAKVEDRLALRRAQLAREWRDARESVARRSRWTPLLALVGVAVVGFGMARRGLRRDAGTGSANPKRRGASAAMVTAVGAAARLALSPSGQALWNAWRKSRTSAP